MKWLIDALKRFSSRKFLITIAGILAVTQFPEYADKIVLLIGTYVGAEGAADVVGRYRTYTKVTDNIDMSDYSQSGEVTRIVPGQ